MAGTAASMGPLLQQPGVNCHATLVTLFLNAVYEVYQRFKNDPKIVASELKRVLQYRPPKSLRRSVHDAESVMNIAGTDSVRDGDKYFDMYV